jgi:rRNA maturation RNase YbeY
MKKDLKSWQNKAQRRLLKVLEQVESIASLAQRPCRLKKGTLRQASVRLVNVATMKKLNSQFRGKPYATDVLSFSPPAPFAQVGILGELVICFPVLKAQAREQGHSEAFELDVLLTHGVLHLLGFDHELGPREAKEMGSWEARILKLLLKGPSKRKGLGLIERVHSGTKEK